MQLTLFPVRADTVVIVKPIGRVGILLDFGKEDAFADGVDKACRNVKAVAFFDLDRV